VTATPKPLKQAIEQIIPKLSKSIILLSPNYLNANILSSTFPLEHKLALLHGITYIMGSKIK